jgi:hypothetical protein
MRVGSPTRQLRLSLDRGRCRVCRALPVLDSLTHERIEVGQGVGGCSLIRTSRNVATPVNGDGLAAWGDPWRCRCSQCGPGRGDPTAGWVVRDLAELRPGRLSDMNADEDVVIQVGGGGDPGGLIGVGRFGGDHLGSPHSQHFYEGVRGRGMEFTTMVRAGSSMGWAIPGTGSGGGPICSPDTCGECHFPDASHPPFVRTASSPA